MTALRSRFALVALLGTAPMMAGGAAPAAAQDVFTRLTDIRPGTGSGVHSLSAVVWNDALYFLGYVDDFDSRIFRYDGANPPVEVAGAGAMPDELVIFDDEIYFRGGGFSDRELWHWDGVNLPAEAFDLLASGSGGFPEGLSVLGGRICFGANTTQGYEPVCWDGVNPPTIFDLVAGNGGSNADNFAVANGALYFSAFVPATGVEGYAYTGSGQPTLLADLRPGTASSSPANWVALGVDLYFTAGDSGGQRRLFRKLAAQAPEQDPIALDVEGEIGEAAGLLFVPGHDDDDTSQYVHFYDGLALTRLQPSTVFADSYIEHRGAVYFVAGFSSPDRDIWRWCGSESAELVSTGFAATSDAIGGGGLVEFDGRLFFSGFQSQTTGGELWVLDAMTPLFCHGFDGDGIAAWSDSVP